MVTDSHQPPDRRRRAAREFIETDRLLGVEFVPYHRESARAAEPATGAADPVDKEVALAALAALLVAHDAECVHCTSATGHTRTVFGEGDPGAELMFVGEAPGAEEDRTGRPFVGRAGKKLDEMIAAMGFARENVYIANILKSRPPDNRTPLANEVAGCAPWLAEQIKIIQPRVIVALGGPASKFMLGTETGITRIRGQWGLYRVDDLEVDVMPTFHPAYLLRNYTRETRENMWSDLQAVVERLGADR